MGKVCHVRTFQMTCSAVGQIFWPFREWLTHVVFLLVIPPKFNKQMQMPNRSTNDVSWIHTRTSNNQQLQVKLTSFSPSWLSWSWGFAERSGSWGFPQPNLSSSILQTSHLWRHILSVDLLRWNKKQATGSGFNSKKSPPSIFCLSDFCFITLILDSYMTHHFSKKKHNHHWKMLGLTLIYIYIMIKSSSPKPKNTSTKTHVFMDDSTEFLRWRWQIIDTRTALEVNQTSTNPGNQLLLGGKLLGGK